MSSIKEQLTNYARLLLQEGVNLQKGQTLVINVDVENYTFAELVTKEAYKLQAANVIINWRHTPISKERLLHAPESTLKEVDPWVPAYYKTYIDKKAAFLSLISADPKALQGVDSKRVTLQSSSINTAIPFYHKAIMESAVTWCVAAVASLTWANLLGYTGSDDEKLNSLWQTIFTLCRIDHTEPGQDMSSHLKRLEKRTRALNAVHFIELHYTDAKGSDLHIKLPKNHVWEGGTEASKEGILFNANIPSEEVFTAPDRLGVNGIIHSSKPLIYQGNRIDNFTITFKNGKVVDYQAKEGRDFLTSLFDIDEGSSYLGEVALVDHYSPISQSGHIFYETLFDENASCHLAFGAAYPTCLAESDGLSKEELEARGLNQSMSHVDFMVGSESLSITGIKNDGQTIQIMKEGHLLL